AAFTASQNSL
ncbi:hypothetical protein EC960428_1858, partial [Escherichia coli 96.0428]